MRSTIRLSPLGTFGPRAFPSEMFGSIKRALAPRAPRRALRPLEDIDGWSDQAEVSFYEDVRLSRVG